MVRTIRKAITFLIIATSAFGAHGAESDAPTDSTRAHRLRPVEVYGAKLGASGTGSIEAVTDISGAQARSLGIQAAKGVSLVAPNFYMPDYGSRMTSSIYVRGLGARIDQPVVGLSVDNIPYLNKDMYDFDIDNIANIEVLRGAQSVLNGRNTMGGQINIRTLSPLSAKGLRAALEYGSANTVSASAAYYKSFRPTFGMSLDGRYRHTDGYFRNAYNGKRLDNENSGSLRWKTAWQPSAALSLTNTAVFGLSKQGGYPYILLGNDSPAYDDTCAYRRTTFADGLTVAWAGKRVVVTSVTSFQYLDDSMRLDQDFTTQDYFTLLQKRREWAVTEDLFTRGQRGHYSWLGGVYAFYRSNDMKAPVTFKDTGIAQLIESHRNAANPEYPIRWDSRMFTLGSDFQTRTGGFAIYHESGYSAGRWRFEAGIRLDVEKATLNYRSHTNTGYTIMHIEPDGTESTYMHTPIDIDDKGSLSKVFTELLPKLTVSYEGDGVKPYLTFSKGYKAGGFNTQMFSDALQQRLMSYLGVTALYTLDQIIAYKPEYSYNYEGGVHWTVPVHFPFRVDGALFYIDCRDQQLTTFPSGTTTGRIMTNAGRTRSYGAELTARLSPISDLEFYLSYGYTNATFVRYNNGIDDFKGRRLPYAPSQTMLTEATYRATPLSFCGITPSITATARCVGDIYWDEANTVRQPFYCLPELSISFAAERWSARLWATNLSNTRYDVFYFVSMSRHFTQRGLPRRFGITLRYNLQ